MRSPPPPPPTSSHYQQENQFLAPEWTIFSSDGEKRILSSLSGSNRHKPKIKCHTVINLPVVNDRAGYILAHIRLKHIKLKRDGDREGRDRQTSLETWHQWVYPTHLKNCLLYEYETGPNTPSNWFSSFLFYFLIFYMTWMQPFIRQNHNKFHCIVKSMQWEGEE